MSNYVVGISGASGVLLGFKTADALLTLGHTVFLVISDAAKETARYEMTQPLFDDRECVNWFSQGKRASLHVCPNNDCSAPIASGTFPSQGMVIVPCSMNTLASLAVGLSDTLLKRAADVTRKEKRRLVLVPREAPFSSLHLENMLKLSREGVSIVPPVPAWYAHPKTIDDVENHIVGRILDALGLSVEYRRWE